MEFLVSHSSVSLLPLAQLVLDFRKVTSDIPYILSGVVTNLSFTLVSALFGFLWGTILAIFKIANIKPLQWFADFYTSIFRGTPLILQIVIIYFATPQLLNYPIPAFLAGVIAFSLNSAAYSSETIRGGIMGVDKGQREAAQTLGVMYLPMMMDIVLPQAFKNILPALVNESIALLKDSALVSVIGVEELMRRGQIVAQREFIYFEPLLVVGVVFYLMIMGFTWVARRFEKRMRVSD